ncbi:hypothetical protein C5B42_02060 [Candidatus Cerribacteria bacterium 'Amazon FNV 2010 28 9']|uniref:Glycosyltransferase 2-like domain-containing protein n=1 Tax=Candidatus Cerribacteria bacterium 'Amazon FNV 2010 28 9' TaxID=2081795 RepID=A0A317JQA5_9BACT|nr:MAG: hypothetical protein C5B42_02060 [Candidatus Cerribacteria bacterium 'Amazon FNV 2010 28 9']
MFQINNLQQQPFDWNNMNLPLTIVIINKNSEQTLTATLGSLSFASSILIADDGSTDRSREIAREFGTKVISLHPTHSFAQKRNEALSHVTTPWTFFIDSDEICTQELAASITDIVTSEHSADGYYIHRNDVFMGVPLLYGETGHMWLLRLARTDSGIWERDVHEVWKVNGTIRKIKQGILLHAPHPTLDSFFSMVNIYTELEVKERSKHPPSLFALYLQVWSFPLAKFFVNVCVRQGWRDGFEGIAHAYCMSIYSLVVRIKMIEYLRKHS